VTTVCEAFGGI